MISRQLLTLDQLAAIGSAAVESTHTEGLVHDIIVFLSGTTQKKLAPFMSNLMIDAKLSILESLGLQSLKSAKAKAEFAVIIQDLRAANRGRVSLIHGLWEVKNMLRLFGQAMPDGKAVALNKRKPGVAPVSAVDAERLAQNIADAHAKLNRFYCKRWLLPAVRRTRAREKVKPVISP